MVWIVEIVRIVEMVWIVESVKNDGIVSGIWFKVRGIRQKA